MIKQNELRLGNYIFDVFDLKDIVIRKIDLEDLSMFINYSNHPLPFKPIPLTEEILLKCDCYWVRYIENIDGKFFFQYFDLEIELPYLHTFQNFIFALTNQELNIEL